MTHRSFRFGAGTALALLASSLLLAEDAPKPPLPPPPPSAGPISVQINAEGSLLVVTDSPRQAMAVYRVNGNVLTLLDVRRLDSDFAEERTKDTVPAPTTPPTKDVPGQDPPSFARPAKAVRLSTAFNADWAPGDRWYGTYAIPGTLEEVYAKLRSSYAQWKTLNESTDSDRLSFKASNDNRKIEVKVGPYRRAAGWVFLEFVEERSRN